MRIRSTWGRTSCPALHFFLTILLCLDDHLLSGVLPPVAQAYVGIVQRGAVPPEGASEAESTAFRKRDWHHEFLSVLDRFTHLSVPAGPGTLVHDYHIIGGKLESFRRYFFSAEDEVDGAKEEDGAGEVGAGTLPEQRLRGNTTFRALATAGLYVDADARAVVVLATRYVLELEWRLLKARLIFADTPSDGDAPAASPSEAQVRPPGHQHHAPQRNSDGVPWDLPFFNLDKLGLDIVRDLILAELRQEESIVRGSGFTISEQFTDSTIFEHREKIERGINLMVSPPVFTREFKALFALPSAAPLREAGSSPRSVDGLPLPVDLNRKTFTAATPAHLGDVLIVYIHPRSTRDSLSTLQFTNLAHHKTRPVKIVLVVKSPHFVYWLQSKFGSDIHEVIWEPDLNLDFRDLDLWMTTPRTVDWICKGARVCWKWYLPDHFWVVGTTPHPASEEEERTTAVGLSVGEGDPGGTRGTRGTSRSRLGNPPTTGGEYVPGCYVKLSPLCPDAQKEATLKFARSHEHGLTDDESWLRDVIGEQHHNALVDGYLRKRGDRIVCRTLCARGDRMEGRGKCMWAGGPGG